MPKYARKQEDVYNCIYRVSLFLASKICLSKDLRIYDKYKVTDEDIVRNITLKNHVKSLLNNSAGNTLYAYETRECLPNLFLLIFAIVSIVSIFTYERRRVPRFWNERVRKHGDESLEIQS